jgi:hypothetical protein
MSLCRRTDVSELNSTKINVKCSTAFDIWPLIDRTASFYSLWFNTIDNPLGGVMVSVKVVGSFLGHVKPKAMELVYFWWFCSKG